MARIRSIKPEFRTSLTATSWPRDVRLFFVLLWGYVDDEGRAVDEPRLIKADCFPLDDDVTPDVVDSWLQVMAESGSVVRYEVDGRRYLAIPSWSEHQKPQHPKASRIPRPPVDGPGAPPPEASPDPGSARSDHREGLPENVMKINGSRHPVLTPEGEGEQGAGRGNARAEPLAAVPASSARGPEPPRKCLRHVHTPNPPACGACADARKDHEAWQRSRSTPTPGRPTCPRHPGTEIGSQECPACAAVTVPPPADFRSRHTSAGVA